MADLTPIIGPTAMLDALPGEFVAKANIEKLWRALGGPVTDYENALVWLQTAFTLDDGAGVQLDALGQLLSQARLGGDYPVGESDADYRVKLRAAILRNRSMGSAEDLRAMVHALLTGKAPVVQIVDVPPAGFTLAVYVSSALSSAEADALVSFCVAAKAAGVGIVGLAWYTSPVFGFIPSTDPPVEGYGDGVPGDPGGAWANYIYP